VFNAEGHERRRREGVFKASGEKPEGVESPGGDRAVGRSNPPACRNGLLLGKRPGGEVSGIGNGGVTRREKKLTNDMRVRVTDEVSWLGSGESP
jgi:hypothetical protein